MRRPTSTIREFRHALQTIDRPGGHQLRFLQRHYSATGRALNMRRLAEAAGYSNYGGVNLQYGKLATRLAQALGRETPDTAVGFLAEFIAPREASNREYVLVMRDAFARALKAEGWLK
jgi:hypothetical protein